MPQVYFNRRIAWLVGVHLFLAAAPLLTMDASMGSVVRWVLDGLPLGVLLTLSVWIGFGRTRLWWRVAISLVANLYVSVFQCIPYVRLFPRTSLEEWFVEFLETAAGCAILLFLLGGTFILIGRRYEIMRALPEHPPVPRTQLQFSLFQIMVVMSAVAVVLGLARLTRVYIEQISSIAGPVVFCAYMFITLLINAACAMFAALGLGRVKRNISLTAIVCIVLGVSTAIAIPDIADSWGLFAGLVVVPTVVTLVSLLVMRSCGYRLVRRSRPDEVPA